MIRRTRISGRTPEGTVRQSTEQHPSSPLEEPHLKGLHRVGRIDARAAKWIAGAFTLVNIYGAVDNTQTANRTDKKPVAGENAEPSDTEIENGTGHTNSGYNGKGAVLTCEQREALRKANTNRKFKRPYAKKSWWWKPNWNPSKMMEDRVGRVLAAFGIIFEDPASIGTAMALSDKARNDCAQAWEEMHNATITALSETNEMSASTCIPVVARNVLAMDESAGKQTDGKSRDYPWSAHFEIAPEEMSATEMNSTAFMAGNTQTQVIVLEPNCSANKPEPEFNAQTSSTHEPREEEAGYTVSFSYSVAPATRREEPEPEASPETAKPGTISLLGLLAKNLDEISISSSQATSQTCAGGKPQTENQNEGVPVNPSRNDISDMDIEPASMGKADTDSILVYVPPVSQSSVMAQPNQATPATAQDEQTELAELAAQNQNPNSNTTNATTTKTQQTSRAEQDAQNSFNAFEINPQLSSQTAQPQITEACETITPIAQNIEFTEENPVFVVSPSTTTETTTFSDNISVPQTNFIPQMQTAASGGITILQKEAAQMLEGLQAQETNTTETTGTPQMTASAETTTGTATQSDGQIGGFQSSGFTPSASGAFSIMAGSTPAGKEGGAYFGSTPRGKNPLRMSTPISPDPEKPGG